MDDPFSDEARLLIEKVASIRATAEELFHIRSEKIVSLAQSQADGSYIERDELRTLIPAELEMFNRIVEAVRASRAALIEWRVGGARSQGHTRVEVQEMNATIPAGQNTIPASPAQEGEYAAVTASDSNTIEYSPDTKQVLPERAYDQEEGWTPSDEEEEEPFPYSLVRVREDMDPFMGVDGRTYELAKDDIITIPRRNAEVLVERDIVLNINPG